MYASPPKHSFTSKQSGTSAMLSLLKRHTPAWHQSPPRQCQRPSTASMALMPRGTRASWHQPSRWHRRLIRHSGIGQRWCTHGRARRKRPRKSVSWTHTRMCGRRCVRGPHRTSSLLQLHIAWLRPHSNSQVWSHSSELRQQVDAASSKLAALT